MKVFVVVNMEDNETPVKDEIVIIKKESLTEIDINTVNFGIKTEDIVCANGICDPPLKIIKKEQTIENVQKPELTSDTKVHIKTEDILAVNVKVEEEESQLDSLKLYVPPEELYIKTEINVSNIPELDGDVKPNLSENRHQQSGESLFICYICDNIVCSKKDLINHIKVEGCSVKSYMKKNLTVHKAKKCPKTKYCVKKFQCVHCKAKFQSKMSRDGHIIRKHEEFMASVSSKIYRCKHCSYKSTIMSHLTRHLTKHPESGPLKQYPCIHCHFICKRKDYLKQHLIRKHKELIPPVCKIKPKPKQCCIHCGKTFKSKASLDDHVIKKHEEFIGTVSHKIHQCKYCNYKTTKKHNLAIHMPNHPEAGVEQWLCSHCDATYKSRMGLDYHVLTKHGEFSSRKTKKRRCRSSVNPTDYDASKPILCMHCSKIFNSKRTLYDHIVKNHQESIASVTSPIHHCKHCTYKTIRSRDLERHQRIRHQTEFDVEPIQLKMEDNEAPVKDEIVNIKKESFTEIDINTINFGIKTEDIVCANGICDPQLKIIKEEQIIENGQKSELTSDAKVHIKMEDILAVNVKVEEEESQLDVKLYVPPEELYIKTEINVSNIPELDSDVKQILIENSHRQSDEGLFICYICDNIVYSKKDLINHIKVVEQRIEIALEAAFLLLCVAIHLSV
nr:unnamed protein product [Callosobruchus analis]